MGAKSIGPQVRVDFADTVAAAIRHHRLRMSTRRSSGLSPVWHRWPRAAAAASPPLLSVLRQGAWAAQHPSSAQAAPERAGPRDFPVTCARAHRGVARSLAAVRVNSSATAQGFAEIVCRPLCRVVGCCLGAARVRAHRWVCGCGFRGRVSVDGARACVCGWVWGMLARIVHGVSGLSACVWCLTCMCARVRGSGPECVPAPHSRRRCRRVAAGGRRPLIHADAQNISEYRLSGRQARGLRLRQSGHGHQEEHGGHDDLPCARRCTPRPQKDGSITARTNLGQFFPTSSNSSTMSGPRSGQRDWVRRPLRDGQCCRARAACDPVCGVSCGRGSFGRRDAWQVICGRPAESAWSAQVQRRSDAHARRAPATQTGSEFQVVHQRSCLRMVAFPRHFCVGALPGVFSDRRMRRARGAAVAAIGRLRHSRSPVLPYYSGLAHRAVRAAHPHASARRQIAGPAAARIGARRSCITNTSACVDGFERIRVYLRVATWTWMCPCMQRVGEKLCTRGNHSASVFLGVLFCSPLLGAPLRSVLGRWTSMRTPKSCAPPRLEKCSTRAPPRREACKRRRTDAEAQAMAEAEPDMAPSGGSAAVRDEAACVCVCVLGWLGEWLGGSTSGLSGACAGGSAQQCGANLRRPRRLIAATSSADHAAPLRRLAPAAPPPCRAAAPPHIDVPMCGLPTAPPPCADLRRGPRTTALHRATSLRRRPMHRDPRRHPAPSLRRPRARATLHRPAPRPAATLRCPTAPPPFAERGTTLRRGTRLAATPAARPLPPPCADCAATLRRRFGARLRPPCTASLQTPCATILAASAPPACAAPLRCVAAKPTDTIL